MGQEISKKVCEQTFGVISNALDPAKVYRREIYKTDCDFEFTTRNGVSARISIEKFKSGKEGRENLAADLDMYTGFRADESPVQNLDLNEYWDESIFYKSKGKTENFILLRKDSTVFSIFSRDPEIPFVVERLLRKVEFE